MNLARCLTGTCIRWLQIMNLCSIPWIDRTAPFNLYMILNKHVVLWYHFIGMLHQQIKKFSLVSLDSEILAVQISTLHSWWNPEAGEFGGCVGVSQWDCSGSRRTRCPLDVTVHRQNNRAVKWEHWEFNRTLGRGVAGATQRWIGFIWSLLDPSETFWDREARGLLNTEYLLCPLGKASLEITAGFLSTYSYFVVAKHHE